MLDIDHTTPKYEGVTFKTNASKPDAPKKASTPTLFLVGVDVTLC